MRLGRLLTLLPVRRAKLLGDALGRWAFRRTENEIKRQLAQACAPGDVEAMLRRLKESD